MDILSSLDFIPGVGWFETEMHDSLFQHSVFGAITFLVLSHSDLYKFVSKLIKVKDQNVLMIIHAIVFAIVMYLGSLFILQPLLTEGSPYSRWEELKDEGGPNTYGGAVRATVDKGRAWDKEAADRAATAQLARDKQTELKLEEERNMAYLNKHPF